MCTSAETVFTTTSITTVSVSMRSAQSASSEPDWIKRNTGTVKASPVAEMPTLIEGHPGQQRRRHQEARGDVFGRLGADASCRTGPTIRKPSSGRKTIAWYMVIPSLNPSSC